MKTPLRLLLIAAALAAGCTHQQRINSEKALATALVSDQQEEQLGLQVQGELVKQGIHYLNDAVVTAYVDQVAARILNFAKKERPGVTWHVYVIDDAKTVNAFATPGGHLYVYSGLLLTADNEAELAGVLAHEAGHVVARHSARQLVGTYGVQKVTDLALGKNPNQIAQLAAQFAGKGALLAHSRSEEEEADEYGARYSSAAGYDPDGLVQFFEKLKAQEGHSSKLLTLLQTHPATQDRINHIKAYVGQNRLGGSDTGANRLAPIKQRLPAPR